MKRFLVVLVLPGASVVCGVRAMLLLGIDRPGEPGVAAVAGIYGILAVALAVAAWFYSRRGPS